MKIDSKTRLRKQAQMFTDGEGGSYTQHHKLFDENDVFLGVDIHVQGARDSGYSTQYLTENGSFDNLKDALRSAGHDVVD